MRVSSNGSTTRLTTGALDRRSTAFAPLGSITLSGVGERIAIQNGAGRRDGVFEGIDATGRLLMHSEHGLDAVEAADVWLLPRSGVPPQVILPASHPPEGRA